MGAARLVRMTVVGAAFVGLTIVLTRFHGHDALAYWLVDPSNAYALAGHGLTGQGAFRYSPAVAILMGPLGLFPWPVFTTAWLAAQLVVLWRLGGRWWLALVLLPPVALDLVAGNVDLFLALAVASAFRYPGAWALLALTKVTPIVGALWFVGRHDWRGLAWVVAITAAIVAASVLLTGVEPWVQWAQVLGSAAWATPEGIHLPISVLPRAPRGGRPRLLRRRDQPGVAGAGRGHAGDADAVADRARPRSSPSCRSCACG